MLGQIAQETIADFNGPAYANQYPRFSNLMDSYGYDWEAVKVHTEDKYILSTFHILGKAGVERDADAASQGTVLIQHGDRQDGTSMMSNFEEGLPFHLQLVDAGYDVWIGNNRGTMYSWEHETLDVNTAEYWDWTWSAMGLYDDVANIKAIK